MFERVMELLERGVCALEVIAVALGEKTTAACGDACACKEEPAGVFWPEVREAEEAAPEVHPTVTEMAEADAAYLEREFLKKELVAKGIKFKSTARTETLKKLLAEATVAENLPGEVVVEVGQSEDDGWADPPAAEAPVAEPVRAATKDEAREALVNLSASKGKDIALKVLKEIGGAEKLSDVPEANYGKIVEACHGAN